MAVVIVNAPMFDRMSFTVIVRVLPVPEYVIPPCVPVAVAVMVVGIVNPAAAVKVYVWLPPQFTLPLAGVVRVRVAPVGAVGSATV